MYWILTLTNFSNWTRWVTSFDETLENCFAECPLEHLGLDIYSTRYKLIFEIKNKKLELDKIRDGKSIERIIIPKNGTLIGIPFKTNYPEWIHVYHELKIYQGEK